MSRQTLSCRSGMLLHAICSLRTVPAVAQAAPTLASAPRPVAGTTIRTSPTSAARQRCGAVRWLSDTHSRIPIHFTRLADTSHTLFATARHRRNNVSIHAHHSSSPSTVQHTRDAHLHPSGETSAPSYRVLSRDAGVCPPIFRVSTLSVPCLLGQISFPGPANRCSASFLALTPECLSESRLSTRATR